MVVIDITIATQIESMTDIPGNTQKSKKPIQPIQQIQKKTISPKIINLSKYELSKPELFLLLRGRKFTPTSKGNSLNLKSDIFDFTRRIQMQEIFYGQDYQDESLVSNKSNKQFKSKDLELQHLVKSIENIQTEYKPFQHIKRQTRSFTKTNNKQRHCHKTNR